MNRKLNALICAMALAALAGCATNPSHQSIGTASGAAIGAVAGSVLTGGSGVGTVGGAAIGGVIGNQIGKEADRRR
jgi:osmotically inducible lipoprotein OsmB